MREKDLVFIGISMESKDMRMNGITQKEYRCMEYRVNTWSGLEIDETPKVWGRNETKTP